MVWNGGKGTVTLVNGVSGLRGTFNSGNSLVGGVRTIKSAQAELRFSAAGTMSLPARRGAAVPERLPSEAQHAEWSVQLRHRIAFTGVANSAASPIVVDNVNDTFIVAFPSDGRVFVGSQVNGFLRSWHNYTQRKDVTKRSGSSHRTILRGSSPTSMATAQARFRLVPRSEAPSAFWT